MQQNNNQSSAIKTGYCLEHTKEEDLELKQNISRSRNPSSDLIIGIVQLSKLEILVSHKYLMDLFSFFHPICLVWSQYPFLFHLASLFRMSGWLVTII